MELSRLQALNEVLGMQNNNLVGWREMVMRGDGHQRQMTCEASAASDYVVPASSALRAIENAAVYDTKMGREKGSDQQKSGIQGVGSTLRRQRPLERHFVISCAVGGSSKKESATDSFNDVVNDLISSREKRLSGSGSGHASIV
jgi:hypothetical protein